MADHSAERTLISVHISELLARDRASTRPTVTELCLIAGLPRWKLTHRHVDLKNEFLAAVQRKWGSPDSAAAHRVEVDRLRERNRSLRAELDASERTVRIYAEIIEELRLQLSEATAADRSRSRVTSIDHARTAAATK